jgi:arylsulfatase A
MTSRTGPFPFSVLLTLTVLIASGWLHAAAVPSPPNFVIIFCDDLGYADIEPFGAPRTRTPHLTRMAAEGIRFTDFHVTSGVCTPSRASLMTGCYPKRVGLHESEKGAWVLFPGDARGLHRNEITLAEVLKPRGYATACVGKWHLGDQPEFFPTRQGFDSWFGIPFSNDMGQVTDKGRARRGRPPTPLVRDDRVVEEEPDQTQLTRRYTEEALRFLGENRARPFFLYLAHTMPHWPQYASERFAGKSANSRFGDTVEEIDWSTGEILSALKRLGLDERTLVLFTSDNGGPLNQGANNTPLRGGKGTTWEGGFRVPMLARWPGRIPAGAVCGELATTMDLLPTFARLARAEPPRDRVIDGKDIWPLLSGRPGARTPYEGFFYYHLGQLQAVRGGDWKLFVPHVARPRQADPKATVQIKVQLYNLAADICETNNVAAQHPDVVARLTALADRAKEDLGDTSLNLAGRNTREPGHASSPSTLTSVPVGAAQPGGTNGPFALGDELGREDAPQVANRALTITGTVEPGTSNGIIVAHGGSVHGYALWLRDGKLVFTLRAAGKAVSITARETPPGQFLVEARLGTDRTVVLAINGRQAATGTAPGLIPVQPQEDFCVGHDNGNPVGDYATPYRFTGRITELKIVTGPGAD